MNAHDGLSDAQSRRFDAALVLLLANAIDDAGAMRGYLQAARAAVLPQERA